VPRVLKVGSGYMMWYYSNDQIGLATSANGVNWVKYENNPCFSLAGMTPPSGVMM